ncbi:pentapeptide repeat-containing protein [bacterium]|nr:pentapeptide repeat-containing protein [bacterium]
MKATNLFLTLALTLVSVGIQAQSVELDIERSVKVEFNSEKGYSYNVYGTSDPAKKTGWKLLGGEDGTGENIVFFYRTESDQKIFFRVESEPSQPGEEPKPQEPVQSIIPITGLPPAESSGTYNLAQAIGENEIGGVYRIGVSSGTDGVVIVLPHPGQKEYRQKQIKLSIYRGGTGLGSGKVSLKVRTPGGDAYEARKLVDNSSKQLTDEVVILPATALESGRKVVVELFNDTAQTDGAAGGQWVVTTAAESIDSTLAHEWDGANVRLKNADGSWGDWVNLRGEKGNRGDLGSSEYEWRDTEIRFKKTDGTWGQWVDLQGPLGGKGDPGSVVAEGIDFSALERLTRVTVRALRGANLSGMDLSGLDLSYADLMGANLRGTNLANTDLSEAILFNADLRRAKLNENTKIDSKWRLVWEIVNEGAAGSNLSDANLTGANLTGADLSKANLTGADLTGPT